MISGIVVRIKHVRMANGGRGYCMKGTREWFARHPHLSLSTFRVEGLPVEDIEATGDLMALDVAQVARQDHG